jgi:ATP-dependent Zn protease
VNRNLAAARVAYHEAGHVAMAIEFGFRLHRVTIVPDPATGALGTTHFKPIGKWFRPDIDITDRVELRMQREIMCSLAGVAAEQMFTGNRANHVGARWDYESAADMATRLCGVDDEASALIRWLKIRTKKNPAALVGLARQANR